MKSNKLVIYQILVRLFGADCKSDVACGKLANLNNTALQAIRELGVTDIWLSGVIRHASGTAYPSIGIEASHPDLLKGKAGSPYAIRDYYDIDPDLAINPEKRMEEFDSLIARALNSHLGVFIDFVPNHVSRDYESLNLPEGIVNFGTSDRTDISFDPDNNFYYLPGLSLKLPKKGKRRKKSEYYQENPAKATGNDVFHDSPSVNDWYETIKLNYGTDYEKGNDCFYPIPDTWSKMIDILSFWSEKGIRGFRCDMAGMVPLAFWQFAIPAIKVNHPDIIFIAEIYEPHKYWDFTQAGFDYLYDKVGLYDTTRAIIEGHETTHAISGVWKSLNGLDSKMLRFLENHDEQRIASPFFANNPWKGLPGVALAALMNTGPVMIYFGQELGEPASGSSGYSGDDGRTSIFDYTCVPELTKWINDGLFDSYKLSENHQNLRKAYQQILLFASRNPIFSTGHFYDLMWINEDLPAEIRNLIFAFLRYSGQEIYLIAVNFSADISEVNIRLSDHTLQELGLKDQERFRIKSLHPAQAEQQLLTSQITSKGVRMVFDQTSWSVAKLEL